MKITKRKKFKLVNQNNLMIESKKAIKQLNELEKLTSKETRLAAEGWNKNWKTLIAIMMSAQTRDTKTIEVCERLFKKYNSLKKLSNAKLEEIEKEIKSINYYKTKAKNIIEISKILLEKKVRYEFDELIKLPGIGRKTANVYLAEVKKENRIGVDTHVYRISRKLNWANSNTREKVEQDLIKLFPEKYHYKINYILVRFGQTYGKSSKKEDLILEKIKTIV
ncbi:MAG: endonuclease III [Candidatus Nanoarchaeia archaeon]|nr:endonuclease III [Candidatus Nanoarchaeia archaeon]